MMSGTQSNRCLRTKKMTTTITKQLSAPINVSTRICANKKTAPSTKNKIDTAAVKKDRPVLKQSKSSPLSDTLIKTSNDVSENEENTKSDTSYNQKFDVLFVKNNWTCMSDNEKHESTVNFLNTIKDDIITAYEMLTDFRNSDVLREQLVDLSKISTSMMGGMKLDKSPDTASSENTELIAETCDQEIQTTGVSLEDIENNLKNATEEKSQLCSELEAANKTIVQLQRDLEDKTNELNSVSAEGLKFNIQIQESSSTIEVLKTDVLTKNQKLNALYDERNKFKYELFDKTKETDKIAEELINEQTKNAKLNSAYLKVKSEVDELNAERIHHALQISDKIDELNLRTEEVAHLEKVISVQKETIDALTEDNDAKAYGIKKLKSKVKWLEETIRSKKNCLIPTCVRDKLEGKIDTLKMENKKLQMNIEMLKNTNEHFAEEIRDHRVELENYQNTKHNYLEDQESVIEMMRDFIVDKETGNSKPTIKRIKSVFDKLEITKKDLGNYEVIMNRTVNIVTSLARCLYAVM